jgi:hypothetical protein
MEGQKSTKRRPPGGYMAKLSAEIGPWGGEAFLKKAQKLEENRRLEWDFLQGETWRRDSFFGAFFYFIFLQMEE